MTFRAFLIGLLGATFLCGYSFYNDYVLFQTLLVGTHFPLSVYGSLIVFLIFLNPCLHLLHKWFGRSWLKPLSGREFCLIMALVLPACAFSTSSFLRIVPRALMLPHHYAKTNASWKLLQEDGTYKPVTSYLPKHLMADPEEDDALVKFIQGARTDSSKPISLSEVPWRAWKKPLVFWLPLYVVMGTALTGLALVFHRQWASNEHLPYPIVNVARSMLPDKDGKMNGIFKNKVFWIGLLVVLVIHTNNYLHQYFPDQLIPIRRTYDFRAFRTLFPTLVKGGGYGTLMWIRCYYAVIGLAYMLPTDVCLSVGFSPFVFFTIFGIFVNLGYPLRRGTLYQARTDWGMVFGAYIGFFSVLIYTGRHYYWQTLRRAFGFPGSGEVARESVWGMRVFAVSIVVFILGVMRTGLDWQLSIILAIMMVIAYLVMARILAETGMYHLNPNLYPGVIIMALLGEQALGPTTIALIFFTTTMFFMDTRETFMPFIMSALKFLDGTGRERVTQPSLEFVSPIRSSRSKYFPMLAIVLSCAIVAAVLGGWYFSYDRGLNWRDNFGTRNTPTNPFNIVVTARTQLLAQGLLEESESVRGFERLRLAKPNKPFWIAFGLTFAGVLLFTTLRLRLPWWPVHPVIFCAWSGFAGYILAWSFVIGGVIKVLVTRFGGSKCYQILKPLFLGMIAGDMLSGILVIVAGGLYYFITGEPSKSYWVLPG